MKIKMVLVGFVILLLNGSVAFAELDPLTVYDNFNDKKFNGCKYCINPEKWSGLQRGSVTELLRQIKAKRARLSHRTWGNADSDLGRVRGQNRMQFNNSLNMSGACFVPRVKKYTVQDCATNGDTGDVRIRYTGNFYDTDTTDAGGLDGIIHATINLRRTSNSSDKKGLFEVYGNVDECDSIDCSGTTWSTYDGTDDPDLYFGTIKAATNKKAMCVGYDSINHEFVFSFDGEVKTVNAVDHGLPAWAGSVPAETTWHVIETRADVENCSSGAVSGFIDADFDKVMIREFESDCAGTVQGTAIIDNCGICVGGTTGLDACTQDCSGEWGGTAVIDVCGVCGGDGSTCSNSLGLNCGTCTVGLCFSQSTSTTCQDSDLTWSCFGIAIESGVMSCTQSCQSDADCQNPNVPMKCLTSCPSDDSPIGYTGKCYTESNYNVLTNDICPL